MCGGSFGLPSKYVPKDTPWEKLWGPFFLFVTVVMPLVVGPLLVNDLFGIYARVGASGLTVPLVFGFLWGAGSMTLGLSFAFIGLSLAYSLNYGAQIIFGALTPMLLLHRDRIGTPQGMVILLGVAVCVVGVVLSGRAGMLKDQDAQAAQEPPAEDEAPPAPTGQPKMLIGLLIAVLSGFLCSCYGTAADGTKAIAAAATAAGNDPGRVSVATVCIILWGGALSACLYCAAKLSKNNTWGSFRQPGTGLVLGIALLMACLHNGALWFANLGFPRLGELGVPLGYPAFMSFAIIVGNVHGFRTGEWQGASARSVRLVAVGIAVLIIGVCVLAQGQAMK
jgi:L-rhamnose-H+ transport protein